MSQAAAGAIDHHHDPSTSTGIPNKKMLMWAFLASDCMFFGSLISTHMIYRLSPVEGNPGATEIFDIELTSFSTFILLMSSLMMALAVSAIQKGQIASMRRCLLTTIFFGAIFLGCQVYEFAHFVHDKQLTLSSSIFGSTFYVLTGTHGTHVAVGVLWLLLMYVRSFQPLHVTNSFGELGKSVLHAGAGVGAIAFSIAWVLGLTHSLSAGEGLGAAIAAHPISLGGTLLSCAVMWWFARQTGPVDFGQANAMDVESMGLYWHFVDIVWIIIFTAVYLIEYVPLI